MGGRLGWGGVGWLEKSDIKLISTQVVVEVEVLVELGNYKATGHLCNYKNPTDKRSNIAALEEFKLHFFWREMIYKLALKWSLNDNYRNNGKVFSISDSKNFV